MAGLPFGGNSESPEQGTPSTGGAATPPPPPSAAGKRKAKKAAKRQSKYGAFNPDELKKGRGLFGFLRTGGGKLTVLAVVLAIGAGVGVYAYTNDGAQMVQQLVLKKAMPANTLITPEDVQPFEVPADSVQDPSLLIKMSQIQSNEAYTKVALLGNTVLTLGSVGKFTRLINELPEGYQLVSITVNPANAAGGSIAAGDVVDIFGSVGDGTTSVFANGMKGVKVIDVIVNPADVAKGATSDPATGASTVGADSPDLKSGIGSIYKLQVTPQQAADIAHAVTGGTDFYLVLTAGTADTPGQQTEVTPPATIPSADSPNILTDNPVTDTLSSIVGNGGSQSDPASPLDTAPTTNPDTATANPDATPVAPEPTANSPLAPNSNQG